MKSQQIINVNTEDELPRQMPKYKEQASELSKWLNILLIIVIFAALPCLYFWGYVNKDWINRIGIILSFLAGFMVAPELIGQEKLTRVENLSEHYFNKTRALCQRTRNRINNYSASIPMSDFDKRRPFTVVGIFLLSIQVAFCPAFTIDDLITATEATTLMLWAMIINIQVALILLFMLSELPGTLLKMVSAFLGIFRKKRLIMSEVVRKIVDNPLSDLFTYGAVAVLIPAGLLSGLVDIILLLFIKFSNLILDRLAGDNRLRYMLVWWGIVFFVLGNALELLATF